MVAVAKEAAKEAKEVAKALLAVDLEKTNPR